MIYTYIYTVYTKLTFDTNGSSSRELGSWKVLGNLTEKVNSVMANQSIRQRLRVGHVCLPPKTILARHEEFIHTDLLKYWHTNPRIIDINLIPGAASVARAWSGYVDSIFDGAISNATLSLFGEMHIQLLGHYPDVLAFLVCLSYASLLGVGVKTSAVINSVFTLINLLVMGVVVCIGFYYAKLQNWTSDQGTWHCHISLHLFISMVFCCDCLLPCPISLQVSFPTGFLVS